MSEIFSVSANSKSRVTSIFSLLCLITGINFLGLSFAMVCEKLVKAGDLKDHSPSDISGEVFFSNDKSLIIHEWKVRAFHGKYYFIAGTSPYNRLVPISI